MTIDSLSHSKDAVARSHRGAAGSRPGGGRYILAAGGTGGHVYPAIAIADALRKADPGASLLFVGTRDRMEWTAVPKAGYTIRPVWISGFDRSMKLSNLLFPMKLVVSLAQSLAIVMRFRPDAIISCGGFASGPVGWVGARLGVPLYLQEQNRTPGVTTKLLMRDARRIFLTFPIEGSEDEADRIRVYGNPTRETIVESVQRPADAHERAAWLESIGLDDDPARPVVLVMGGSGGARRINEAVWSNMDRLTANVPEGLGLQIIWQCGSRYAEEYARNLEAWRAGDSGGVVAGGMAEGEAEDSGGGVAGGEVRGHVGGEVRGHVGGSAKRGVALLPFIDKVHLAYQASSLVVTRAGAGSLSELMIAGKAMILIPSPHVAGDHQTHNARWMEAEGAAVVLTDDHAVEALAQAVGDLMMDPEQRGRMADRAARLAHRDAASRIAGDILGDLRGLTNLTPGIHTN